MRVKLASGVLPGGRSGPGRANTASDRFDILARFYSIKISSPFGVSPCGVWLGAQFYLFAWTLSALRLIGRKIQIPF
ncbi:hypothetical protein [Yersinia pekkanenii]|uniref:hypothetical protein n=1 Tax=Yersinia pekkanenii TaxID=1288385 RepID=UPI00066FD976|nr:hypothetical protein [Yersinia pekkanenii]